MRIMKYMPNVIFTFECVAYELFMKYCVFLIHSLVF